MHSGPRAVYPRKENLPSGPWPVADQSWGDGLPAPFSRMQATPCEIGAGQAEMIAHNCVTPIARTRITLAPVNSAVGICFS